MALATVDEYIQALCPLLFASPLQEVYVDIATDATDEGFYGSKYYLYAVALMAAHYFTIDRNRADGENGLVTGKTEGRLSIRYWNEIAENSVTTLKMTHYGQRILELRRRICPNVSVAGSALPSDGIIPVADE